MPETTEREAAFRRRWYEAYLRRFETDADLSARIRAGWQAMSDSGPDALAIRDELVRTGDVGKFRADLQAWAKRPAARAFDSFSGQMMVNQLVRKSEDLPALARLLAGALVPPRNLGEAATKVQALVDHVEAIKVGAHPAPGHVPFLCSFFWALEEPKTWPVTWTSLTSFVEHCTGETLPARPADRYVRFAQLVGQLDDDPARAETTAFWWEQNSPVLLDPVLVERCSLGRVDEVVGDAELVDNEAALGRVARHIGSALVDDVSEAVGRGLADRRPPRTREGERPTPGMWVDWVVGRGVGLGIHPEVTHTGAGIGLRPGSVRAGWLEEARGVVADAGLDGFRLLSVTDFAQHHGLGAGDFTYARWFGVDELADLDLRSTVVATAAALQPLLDHLVQRATGEAAPDVDDPLVSVVEEFRQRRGYPTSGDEEHRADRARFSAMLAADSLALADPAELRQIWNTRRYGSPGPQSNLNRSLRDADASEFDRILDTITYLCWGGGDDAQRIDEVLAGQRRVPGLGESVIMKLLAICHPDRYVPVYPYSGPMGKRRMLQLLELDEPAGDSRGALQVAANDVIRQRLDRLFPGDPWGMGQFLYWYAKHGEESEVAPDVDPLDDLAEDLLLDREFLDEIVALLEDKGQVIFYGPPGTGKTYLARRLAEALVSDPTRRSLVQFHPSTSYEDFFEGYRPETSVEGEMTYRLTPGPLALLAARAADAPGKRHLMIIDEINRANLPRVLGELLFLFEYRDEQVRTLYRPDDAFELPGDLWFIGTMNTADRSIALVDAALRRRFHFVPFFPHSGPMEGLLDRWLLRHDELSWVGELVAMVNDELSQALGGSHLLLGPSHFMKRGLDEALVRRIWTYNIEPFIEDQFFGDQTQIDHFRFDAAYARYRASLGLDESPIPAVQVDDGEGRDDAVGPPMEPETEA